ncbi:hypothetical protein SONE68_4004 (plasmid) [Lacticaseibacillus paracasei]|nr:hypothetical protein SONE68_4004 [Lacticaseibacillus paracasei]
MGDALGFNQHGQKEPKKKVVTVAQTAPDQGPAEHREEGAGQITGQHVAKRLETGPGEAIGCLES